MTRVPQPPGNDRWCHLPLRWIARRRLWAAIPPFPGHAVNGTWVGGALKQPARKLIALFSMLLYLACCGTREETGFVSGRPEDEMAIREIINTQESQHYAKEVDWENAFGGRFLGREAVGHFMDEMVRPSLLNVLGSQRVTVRFLHRDLALADAYWRMTGQEGDPERTGRNTYVLSRRSGDWHIVVVRVADLRTEPIPTLKVDMANPWPSVELSVDQLSLYEGEFEEASFGGMPVPIRIWLETGILRSETMNYGTIDLVPMGGQVFATGRYTDGKLAEVYWPEQRQIFKIESG